MKFQIVFIAVFLMACQINAENLDNSLSQEESLEPTNLEICEERICSRMYSPICISVNGEERTLPSLCHLANYRCELMRNILESSVMEIPEFHVLHFGECEE